MTKRRSKGDGGLHWDEGRQRWIASVTVGYTPSGKRIVRKASGKTKTAAKEKLKEILRDHDDGMPTPAKGYTVGQAVMDWLEYGLTGRAEGTVETRRSLAKHHVIPQLGARKLRELSAEDVDRWLAEEAKKVSTRTLRDLRSILRRSVARAQARDKVKRNVVLLCELPEGRPGRPSKSFTRDEALAVLTAARGTSMYAYIVLSLLTGARTEELRALPWSFVDLNGDPEADPPIPPSIKVWTSVRRTGDTKTEKSRRTLALPNWCVEVLREHKEHQDQIRRDAGLDWEENGLVFTSRVGTPLDKDNVRRAFRKVVEKAGLNPADWVPRELRHSFVSLLSDNGMPIENISRLVGHSDTRVTETVYRHQLRPVLQEGAEAMDEIFRRGSGARKARRTA
ncbi:tyrosine-type recombinase/integrase [Bailinhaonella thermotolerans]|uniref:Site-specific integrase n=1 Tax=Bailinhaonella thermotolerans TaxID=1070861 RepID=A0A3A4A1I2_9ACTN|nr:site-specific integrase [Bailinhaonella thermotolerans]RJL22018.1 site-specific integrase [Bailinhaonella thermotolerans]